MPDPVEMPLAPPLVFSRAAIRALDQAAITEYAIPSILLMEHASLGVARNAEALVEPGDPLTALVFAGKGGNGGDGLAAARHLTLAGWNVAVVLAAPESAFAGDALTNLRVIRAMGIPTFVAADSENVPALTAALDAVMHPTVIIDALLGSGLTGPVTGVMLALITRINLLGRQGSRVLSVDLPSGMDADSGEPTTPDTADRLPVVVRADLTVTFVGLKQGFLSLRAQEFVGDIAIEPIGAPPQLAERFGARLPGPLRPGADAHHAPRPRAPRQPRPARPGETDPSPIEG